jgi:hypothetical protein
MPAMTRPVPQLTLYLPGTAYLPDFFTQLLARADTHDATTTTGINRLLTLFDISVPPGQDPPVAAITRVADMGVIDNDWWIRADPVHFTPQRDGLYLQPVPGLTTTESDRLATELNEALVPEGWLLKAPHHARWYLKPAREPRLSTTSLPEATGRNVHPLLPQGEDRHLWHTRLNELQILLHTSPVNAEREARGELSANSVWFWGGGRLPRLGKPAWTVIWANDALAAGLARLAGIPLQAVREFQHASKVTTHEFMVLDEDPQFAEVLQAVVTRLNSGDYRALTVLTDTGPERRYQRWHRWRFWRRNAPQVET